MFYQKTDAEVFCETLLRLVEKQEKFIETHHGNARSPFEDAIHIMLIKVESHEKLASAGQKQQLRDVAKEAEKKAEKPKRHYFRKQGIEVMHGKPDDMKEETPAERLKRPLFDSPEDKKANTTSLSKVSEKATGEIVTPENVDKLTENLLGEFEPNLGSTKPL